MTFRDTITDLETQLDETKRSYLRSHGWEVTYRTPGASGMWQRQFDGGMVLTDIGAAVQMTMAALDPECQPDEDSAE